VQLAWGNTTVDENERASLLLAFDD
jgi:hypothetical protein